MRYFYFFIPALVFAQSSWAQVDSTSILLLNSESSKIPAGGGLESGRYKILPSRSTSSAPATATEPVPSTKLAQTKTKQKQQDPSSTPLASSELGKSLFSEPPPPAKAEAPADDIEVQQPSMTDQLRGMVLGQDQPIVEAYKERVHPDDVRLNRIEIDIASGVFSNHSQSNYSFREYNSTAPQLKVGAQFWFTPFLGIYGDYMMSLGADVAGDPVTRSRVAAHHEWTEIGLDFRQFFGMSRKANSVEFGFHFSEYKLGVPSDDSDRVQLKSTGIGLHLSSRIPVAPSYAWILGGKLMPRVQHKEIETGVAASSGTSSESSRVDAFVGGEFKMSRQNQILWNLTSSFEKNQFQGTASLRDPSTGAEPRNVSVTNTVVVLSLGYRWGQ